MENEKLWELVEKWKESKETFQLNSDGLETLSTLHLSESDFHDATLELLDIPISEGGLWK
ncbi:MULTISPECIES: hypothetical protein [Marinilactibacillus]|uniref:Phage protein n=1 Tax=Marinilactibacillus psychrotolerans TaxID=191770 RepID=A0AAV3WQ31_9LACT|nr:MULTISPECIES: hypothetical protein [Marinilactibacillus]API88423.1 hypothetical protein BKP56_03520 [Marinilactibacillus sp. 15R]GEL67954.1 hypothetical protein MPS01_21090 [Marinilactibacillus psychrotolerans]GEQ35395.1 hypothetical protein M132T_09030 [Marinilactibacillus psychrotolerans]SDD27519.1 hypothetical protein SAMN04488013_12334 [Marinilactibacillus psychrotolerans]